MITNHFGKVFDAGQRLRFYVITIGWLFLISTNAQQWQRQHFRPFHFNHRPRNSIPFPVHQPQQHERYFAHPQNNHQLNSNNAMTTNPIVPNQFDNNRSQPPRSSIINFQRPQQHRSPIDFVANSPQQHPNRHRAKSSPQRLDSVPLIMHQYNNNRLSTRIQIPRPIQPTVASNFGKTVSQPHIQRKNVNNITELNENPVSHGKSDDRFITSDSESYFKNSEQVNTPLISGDLQPQQTIFKPVFVPMPQPYTPKTLIGRLISKVVTGTKRVIAAFKAPFINKIAQLIRPPPQEPRHQFPRPPVQLYLQQNEQLPPPASYLDYNHQQTAAQVPSTAKQLATMVHRVPENPIVSFRALNSFYNHQMTVSPHSVSRHSLTRPPPLQQFQQNPFIRANLSENANTSMQYPFAMDISPRPPTASFTTRTPVSVVKGIIPYHIAYYPPIRRNPISMHRTSEIQSTVPISRPLFREDTEKITQWQNNNHGDTDNLELHKVMTHVTSINTENVDIPFMSPITSTLPPTTTTLPPTTTTLPSATTTLPPTTTTLPPTTTTLPSATTTLPPTTTTLPPTTTTLPSTTTTLPPTTTTLPTTTTTLPPTTTTLPPTTTTTTLPPTTTTLPPTTTTLPLTTTTLPPTTTTLPPTTTTLPPTTTTLPPTTTMLPPTTTTLPPTITTLPTTTLPPTTTTLPLTTTTLPLTTTTLPPTTMMLPLTTTTLPSTTIMLPLTTMSLPATTTLPTITLPPATMTLPTSTTTLPIATIIFPVSTTATTMTVQPSQPVTVQNSSRTTGAISNTLEMLSFLKTALSPDFEKTQNNITEQVKTDNVAEKTSDWLPVNTTGRNQETNSSITISNISGMLQSISQSSWLNLQPKSPAIYSLTSSPFRNLPINSFKSVTPLPPYLQLFGTNRGSLSGPNYRFPQHWLHDGINKNLSHPLGTVSISDFARDLNSPALARGYGMVTDTKSATGYSLKLLPELDSLLSHSLSLASQLRSNMHQLQRLKQTFDALNIPEPSRSWAWRRVLHMSVEGIITTNEFIDRLRLLVTELHLVKHGERLARKAPLFST